jgi:formylglycine-generating enzyme required for sulfatase activity
MISRSPVVCVALSVVALALGQGRRTTAQGAPPAPPVDYEQPIPGTDLVIPLVAIPGGHLAIPQGAKDSETSPGKSATIAIEPFWIGKYEITWAAYRQYMNLCSLFEQFDDAGLRQVEGYRDVDAITAPSKLYDPSFTYTSGDGPNQPAVSMTQYAAKQFTKWLSLTTGRFYRLPTDAEWEYACRAGTTTAYSYGDDPSQLDSVAWYYDNADDMTHPIGEKRPNAWGLYDMHGNACEWVLDEYREDWYGQFAGRTVPGEEAICWPRRPYPRILRGGSWNLDPPDCRSDSRRRSDDDQWQSYDPNSPQSPWWFASDESQDVGFRIVRPAVPPPRAQWNKYWDADSVELERVIAHRIDNEGRGERGLADPSLPEAIDRLRSRSR